MIGSIVLTVLGIMILLGIGHSAVKDFGVPSLALILLAAAIVGLNFIPPFTFGEVTFSIGTLLLVATALFFLIFGGTLKNRLICLLITVALTGLLYGSVRLAGYFGAEAWSSVNLYHGLIIGALAFALTRNTKYGFIAGVLSVAATSLVFSRNFDLFYTPAILAGSVAAVLYATVSALMPKRPSRFAYYFETGRMLD
ncbi:MAG: hypothetical protein J5781_08075 [Clostridia bacterium]|nr:hypothetical protein [Clostridia bacterium]